MTRPVEEIGYGIPRTVYGPYFARPIRGWAGKESRACCKLAEFVVGSAGAIDLSHRRWDCLGIDKSAPTILCVRGEVASYLGGLPIRTEASKLLSHIRGDGIVESIVQMGPHLSGVEGHIRVGSAEGPTEG